MMAYQPALSATMGFDDRAARRGQLRLVLLEAGAHLRRLADELRAKRLGVGAAGHLLLHARAGLGRGLRNARDHNSERDGGGFQIDGPGIAGLDIERLDIERLDIERLGHGSTFRGWVCEASATSSKSAVRSIPCSWCFA